VRSIQKGIHPPWTPVTFGENIRAKKKEKEEQPWEKKRWESNYRRMGNNSGWPKVSVGSA
jgi:hypothetical protein